MPEKAYSLYYEGKQFRVTNLSAFCTENNLNERHMRQVIAGSRRQHQGWSKTGPIVRPEADRKRIAEIHAMLQEPYKDWEARKQEDGRWGTWNTKTEEWGEVAW